jgi:hypothetical protein
LVPVAFGAGLGGYFFLCLFPVGSMAVFSVALYEINTPPKWLYGAPAISFVGLLLALAYLQKLRLEITAQGVSYTSLLGGTKFVAYAEMIDPTNVSVDSLS